MRRRGKAPMRGWLVDGDGHGMLSTCSLCRTRESTIPESLQENIVVCRVVGLASYQVASSAALRNPPISLGEAP